MKQNAGFQDGLVSKVQELRDLNPGLPCESISLCLVTLAGGVGSNPKVPEVWRLVTLKTLKLHQCT